MFCVLSQKYQYCFENTSILKQIVRETKKWHWHFRSSSVINQTNILHVSIDKSRSAWSTKIVMPFVSQTTCLRMFISFLKKSVDNFEIKYWTCSILVWGAVPPWYWNSLYRTFPQVYFVWHLYRRSFFLNFDFIKMENWKILLNCDKF